MLRILQGKDTAAVGHCLGFQPGLDPLGPFCCLSESSDLRLSRGGPNILAIRFRWMEQLCRSSSLYIKLSFFSVLHTLPDALLEMHLMNISFFVKGHINSQRMTSNL